MKCEVSELKSSLFIFICLYIYIYIFFLNISCISLLDKRKMNILL